MYNVREIEETICEVKVFDMKEILKKRVKCYMDEWLIRKEYYETESHTPDHVEFIKNIEEDAIRRDFKINES